MLILTGLALAGDLDVQWLQDGRILVDGRLLMEPVRGSWQPLLYPTVRTDPSGSHQDLTLNISPSGQVLMVDRADLLLGIFDGRLAASAPLPELLPEVVNSVAVWLDDRRILLAQSSMEGASVCVTLDALTRQWSDPVTCPEGGFARIDQMERGPGPWMAVYSAGEGLSDVRLLRWSRTIGTRETLELTMTPSARLVGGTRVFFTEAGIRLTTPCNLLAEECEEGEIWFYFEWLPTGELRLFRDDLIPGAVPSPKDPATFAWGEGGRVCIGDPAGKRRCYPLPED